LASQLFGHLKISLGFLFAAVGCAATVTTMNAATMPTRFHEILMRASPGFLRTVRSMYRELRDKVRDDRLKDASETGWPNRPARTRGLGEGRT
jgi:hypothetical protein